MKTNFKNLILLVVLIISATLLSCCKKDNTEPSKPTVSFTVSTAAVSAITTTTATTGGSITVTSGTLVITEKGVCFGTTVNPTVSLTTVPISGSSLTAFTSNITGLTANTTYHVRAYVIDESGVKYGNDVVFTTLNNPLVPVVPTVITTTITAIAQTTATSGGNITSNGGATITASGICYATTANPTTASSLVSSTTLTGTFTSNLTGLTANTTYYVRAYATNSVGTAYGSQETFTTLPIVVLPTVSTTTVSAINTTTATSGGNITSNGYGTITASGICYSTTANPTILSTLVPTSPVVTTGTFTSNLTGLTANTTYYVRAYATNSVGTAYGNEVNFTTLPVSAPTITTNSVSSITNTTATSGGNITSNGGLNVTVSGICYSTTSNPTPTVTYGTVINTSPVTSSGSFSSNITGLIFNTTYYVRAYATNSIGTTFGNEVSFTTTILTVGQSYQGGIIAYILLSGDAGYSATVQHGIIANTSDQTSSKWSYSKKDIATSAVLGSGLTNTINIVNSDGSGECAAKLCYNLGNDWCLPSRDELKKLYNMKTTLNMTGSFYWSSTSVTTADAILVDFSTGNQATQDKYYLNSVRAIKNF